MATTSDPMRWRGSSAECRARVLAALGRALGVAPFRRAPEATPRPSDQTGPSLDLRSWARYSSVARGATTLRAGALEPPVNELIDFAHALKFL
jgi:hypothetical protein